MSVSAEHDHVAVRVGPHDTGEPFSHSAASEVRQKIPGRDLAFVPARFAEWRHMRENDDILASGQGFKYSIFEKFGRLVA
jgi:hypothetical protein